MKEFMTQRKDKRLKYVDDHLANNSYLLGDKVSVADAYLYIILTWPTLMLKMDISEYKNITAYQARMAERQAVKDAQAASA